MGLHRLSLALGWASPLSRPSYGTLRSVVRRKFFDGRAGNLRSDREENGILKSINLGVALCDFYMY